jgi:hypothetical protein
MARGTRSRSRHSESGFVNIELNIAICVVGILASIIIPALMHHDYRTVFIALAVPVGFVTLVGGADAIGGWLGRRNARRAYQAFLRAIEPTSTPAAAEASAILVFRRPSYVFRPDDLGPLIGMLSQERTCQSVLTVLLHYRPSRDEANLALNALERSSLDRTPHVLLNVLCELYRLGSEERAQSFARRLLEQTPPGERGALLKKYLSALMPLDPDERWRALLESFGLKIDSPSR